MSLGLLWIAGSSAFNFRPVSHSAQWQVISERLLTSLTEIIIQILKFCGAIHNFWWSSFSNYLCERAYWYLMVCSSEMRGVLSREVTTVSREARLCSVRYDCVPRGTIRDSGFGRQSHDFKHSQNNVFGTVLLSLRLPWSACFCYLACFKFIHL